MKLLKVISMCIFAPLKFVMLYVDIFMILSFILGGIFIKGFFNGQTWEGMIPLIMCNMCAIIISLILEQFWFQGLTKEEMKEIKEIKKMEVSRRNQLEAYIESIEIPIFIFSIILMLVVKSFFK